MYSFPVDAESAHVRDTAYGIRSNEESKAPIKVGKKGASVDNVQFSEDLELRGEPKNFPKGQREWSVFNAVSRIKQVI